MGKDRGETGTDSCDESAKEEVPRHHQLLRTDGGAGCAGPVADSAVAAGDGEGDGGGGGVRPSDLSGGCEPRRVQGEVCSADGSRADGVVRVWVVGAGE